MGHVLKEAFKKEVDSFVDPNFQNAIYEILDICDDMNAIKPSALFHHSMEDRSFGGNFRHIKSVLLSITRIAKILPDYDDQAELDVLKAAAILHDLAKYQSPDYSHTCFDHPIKIKNKVLSIANNHKDNEVLYSRLMRTSEMVARHMSRWTTDKRYPGVELERPTKFEHFLLCMADMIASDPDIHFDLKN